MVSPGRSVAVVIATRDRASLLGAALGALGSLRRAPDRVLVVDSASADGGTVAGVAREGGAGVLRCEVPGTSRARNAGFRATDQDIVAFIDDDCLVDPAWLDGILAAFDHPSTPDFVTGQVRSDAASPGRASLVTAVIEDAHPRTLATGDDPRTFGHGANMAWRRAALDAVGGFDERLGPGTRLRAAEDVDIWVRALRAGLAGRYTPAAVLWHHQWRSRRQMLAAYHAYGVGSGALALKDHKLRRADGGGPSTASLLRTLVVSEGALPVGRALRDRYEMAAVAGLVRFAGVLQGASRARRLGLSGAMFVEDAAAEGALHRRGAHGAPR